MVSMAGHVPYLGIMVGSRKCDTRASAPRPHDPATSPAAVLPACRIDEVTRKPCRRHWGANAPQCTKVGTTGARSGLAGCRHGTAPRALVETSHTLQKSETTSTCTHTYTQAHVHTHTHTHNQIHTFVHRQSQRPRRGGRDGGGGGAHGLDGAHLGRYQARTHPEPPALPLKTASWRIRMFLEYGVDMARSGGVMSMQGGGADNARLCSRTPRVWYRRVAGCTS